MQDTRPSLDLQKIARALGAEVSNGQVLAPGPGHSQHDRSLSIKLDANAPDGFLVHSFANDDPIQCRDYVRERCGLPAFKANGGRQRATSDEIARLFANALEHRGSVGRHVATYQYKDECGVLLYEVLRYEPKTFRQRRPNGGGWIWNLNDVRRVVYRRQELLKYPDAAVFVCEGEKDADRVASLDHCATTVAAGNWTEHCVAALAGRDVVILEDADEAGHNKALAAANALHGEAKTLRIVRLPELTGHPNNKDVSDWLDADPNRANKLVDICFDAPLWTPDMQGASQNNEPVTAVEAHPVADAPKIATENENKIEPLVFIKLTDWQGQPVPEREWAVRDRIPLASITLLSGEGSIGKTILSLQLAVATVLGRDWINTMPDLGPVLAVHCEDDENELHRRLDAIVRHYGATFAELTDLNIVPLAGQDALLAAPNRAGLMVPTKLFARVTQAACDIKPRLIVLDNSADVFGGNENDRAQVRQFIGMLRGLAIAANAGVLLTSHPSLTGISSGTGLSGSTAWNASVRSRLYFKRAVTAKDEEPDADLRVLEVMKSNYGPVGETITLRWKDGLFLPVAAPGSLEKLAREQKVGEIFLMLLDRWNGQGRIVSDKKKANNYAPACFADEPETKADKVTKPELAAAMTRLFAADKIRCETYGPPSHQYTKLVRK